jgi:hypothetical protein
MRTGINFGPIVPGRYVTTPRFVAINNPSPGAIANAFSDGKPCSKPIDEHEPTETFVESRVQKATRRRRGPNIGRIDRDVANILNLNDPFDLPV